MKSRVLEVKEARNALPKSLSTPLEEQNTLYSTATITSTSSGRQGRPSRAKGMRDSKAYKVSSPTRGVLPRQQF